MKPEDIKFPIEIRDRQKEVFYKIIFKKKSWIRWCCSSKCIQGNVESKPIFKPIKGFKLRKDIGDEGKFIESFFLCPKCGGFPFGLNGKGSSFIIRKAWLSLQK